ncbi:MAG: hypothetical protein ABSA82_00325 [Thermacetogeniaceae bacterium]|jgi:hypothetical protein
MNAVLELERAGYSLTIDGDQIRYALAPGREVDAATVKPMLEELRAHKQDALVYLRQRPPADADKLTTGTPDECIALGAACREQIRQKGYCLVRSANLGGAVLGGEVIAVVDSDTRRNLAPAGYVTYTLRELELLAEGYQAGHIVTIGDLRLLHIAKKKLGGVIIK